MSKKEKMQGAVEQEVSGVIEKLITNLKFLDGLIQQDRYLKRWFLEKKEHFSPDQVREWKKMLKEKKISIHESRSRIADLFDEFKESS